MPRGEVDDVELFEVRDLGEHGMACSGQFEHLCARDRAADQGGLDLAAGVVRELDGLTKYRAGLWDGPGPKTLEDLCTQAFEARLLREDVERRERKLLQTLRKVWGVGTSGCHRSGVDPHHPLDKLRVSVDDEADGSVRPAVSDENRRLIAVSSNDAQDRFGLVVESPCRTIGVVPVEARQCYCECTSLDCFQVFEDFVPRPSTQPVAGDKDDGRTADSGRHATTLAGPMDSGMSLFVS